MDHSYQLIVFDWEGTISDTLGCMLHVVASEAKNLDFGAIELHEARKHVDLGLVHLIKKLFPHLSLSEYEQLLQAVQQSIVSKPAEICLMPGVVQFIEQILATHRDIAIATNKGQHSLQRALQSTGLDRLFRVTRSAGQVPAKPCPQMLEELMNEFGATPNDTLMIGDSPADMEMAKNIDVKAIGIDFYHQNEAALMASGAAAVFDNYQSLAEYLALPKR